MYVVAIVDQDTCRTFPDAESAPEGSVIFRSSEELSAIPTTSMDRIRERLLGEKVEPSPSREVAATRLWHVLSLGAGFAKTDWSSRSYQVRKDGFGNRKISDVSPIELIQLTWVRGADHMADHFYSKLPKQARQIVDMLVDDGRKIWTNEQVTAIVMARAHEIETKQDVGAILSFYKSKLFMRKILKKLSYSEFSAKQEFSGMSLVDKEVTEGA